MSKVKVKLIKSGVGELLRSEEVQNFVNDEARAVTIRAGDGYDAESHFTGQRHIVNIFATNKKAMLDNLKNNTLLRALQ